MNVIDLILIVIALLSIWSGYQRGFILGLVDLIVWIGSLLLGFFSYRYVAVFFQKHMPLMGVWTLPVAFILTIIIARLLLSLLLTAIVKTTPETVHNSMVNHALGIIPGFINGVIYAMLAAALLLALPFWNGLSAKTRDSTIANKLAVQIEWLDDKLSPIFGEAAKRTMNNLTVEPKSDEMVKLPFTVSDPKVRPDLEAKMLDMVNDERTKRGLSPLKADAELTEVGRLHSKDMFARGYFSHYTPEGKDPFDRMHKAGVHFLVAGENLALGQTLLICHNGLMNSPGHRANILNPAFGRLGIGIEDGGIYGLMISQEFRN